MLILISIFLQSFPSQPVHGTNSSSKEVCSWV